MLVAVISDIHANLEALKLVTEDIKEKQVDKVVCLGDIVGFHTHPGECIDLLRREGVFCILGNHDAGVIGLLQRELFPSECWDAIEWTRSQLSADHLSYLRSLRKHAIVDASMWLMHGYFRNVTRYLVGPARIFLAAARLRVRDIRLGFYGHTHDARVHRVVGMKLLNNVHEVAPSETLTDGNSVYLCNPGTVGQPRTSDTSASYLTFDSKEGCIRFHRIGYDYGEVLKETLSFFPHHAPFYSKFHKFIGCLLFIACHTNRSSNLF